MRIPTPPLRRVEFLAIVLTVICTLLIVHGTLFTQETESQDDPEHAVWSADMLVVEYTEISIGAASPDLFSNIGGTGDLQIKSLWSYVPDKDLRLAFTNAFDDAEDHTLIVDNLTIEFPAGSSGEQNFKWTNVDLDWTDGQTIKVTIVPTTAVIAVANTNATGQPTISGTPQVDLKLTANTGNISDVDGLNKVAYRYQWKRNHDNGYIDIQGASAQDYTLTFDDQAGTIKVTVSFDDDAGNPESLTSQETAAVTSAPNHSATGEPAISGHPKVRESLTATTSDVNDQDGLTRVSYQYQWLADDTNISGATLATFTPTDADAGKVIKVTVWFNDDRGNAETRTSTATATVASNTPTEPTSLTVTIGEHSQTLSVNWQSPTSTGGSEITGYTVFWKTATDSWDSQDQVSAASTTTKNHTITSITDGVQYTVRVNATNRAGTSAYSQEVMYGTTAEQTQPEQPVAGTDVPEAPNTDDQVTINGLTVVEQVLSADTSAISDDDGLTNPSYTYQWLHHDGSSDTEIAGQNTATYTVANSDVGKQIKLKVSFNDNGSNAESRTSNPTTVVVDKPNVIVILVDDLGYKDVSYNGATEIQTTNIDRIASRGITFTNGYVTYPTCTPSRAGLLTGRYPSRFALEGNLAYAPFDDHHGLPIEETLFPERLQAQDYRTGIVGKWQLGAAKRFNPLSRGFDHFFGFLGGGHNYWSYNTISPHDHTVAPLIEDRDYGEFNGYLTDVLTDKAIEFIEKPEDKPFFLYLAYNAPHTPLQAPQELIDKYSHIDDVHRRKYLAMVDSLDQNIGRLINALDNASLTDNTVIFFLSDNGGMAKEAPDAQFADNGELRDGKDSFHEGGIHVPFLASWPAIWPQNHTYDPMVISLDIAATVLKLASVTAEDPDRPIDGVDLDPFLRGAQDGAPHQALFWRNWRTSSYAVRSGDDKLIKEKVQLGKKPQPVIDNGAAPKLYDLANDLSESQNLMAENAKTAEELAALWNAWNTDNAAGNLFYGIHSYQYDLKNYLQGQHQRKTTYTNAHPTYEIILNTVEPEEQPNNAPDGLPTISGTPQVEETLYASTSDISDADGLNDVSYTYQWLAGDANIQHATGSTHTLTDDEEGKTIKVKVSFTDDQGNVESLTSQATTAVDPRANRPATGAPSMQGVLQDEQVLSADTVGITDADGLENATISYRWMRVADGDAVDITGATSSTYTLTSTDVGNSIQLQAAFTDDRESAESVTSAVTDAVVASGATRELLWLSTMTPEDPDGLDQEFNFDSVANQGSLRPAAFTDGADTRAITFLGASFGSNTTLALELGSEPSTAQTATWKLELHGTELAFADAAMTQTGASPPAYRFQWDVTAQAVADTNPWDDGGTFTVSLLKAVNLSAAGVPTIGGTPQVGETLTAAITGITDGNGLNNATYQYEWTAGSSNIDGATGSSYTLTSSQEGQTIQVQVSFTDDDGFSETATSVATNVVAAAEQANRAAAGLPTISGTPQVEQTLTADTSGISDEDGLQNVNYQYQWLAAGSVISGATGSSYQLTSTEQGKTIQVQVDFTDDRNNSETLTSAATDPVAAKQVPLTASFSDVPASHDGSTEFTFDLSFSENFPVSYVTLRDHAFTKDTQNEDHIVAALRKVQGSNQNWTITVKPPNNSTITITLPETTDCNATGAICTSDGRKLSHSTTVTVAGPQ